MRASIKRRGKHSWSIVFDLPRLEDGRRRQRRRTIRGTRCDAERAAAKFISAIEAENGNSPPRLLSDVAAEWLSARKSSVAPSTYRRYRSLVQCYIRPVLGGLDVFGITPQRINAAVLDWRQHAHPRCKRTIRSRTVRHAFATLWGILESLVKVGILHTNPCKFADRPRKEPAQVQSLSVDEFQTLIDRMDDADMRIASIVGVGTGVRRGELLALRWCDIDLEHRIARIERALSTDDNGKLFFKAPKSRKSIRKVSLPQFVVDALRDYRVQVTSQCGQLNIDFPPDRLLFATVDGGPIEPDKFSARFHYLVRSRQIPLTTFHGLRHTFASLSLAAGTNLKVTSEALGHSSSAITADLYSHVTEEVRADAAQRLDQHIKGNSEKQSPARR